MYHNLALDWHNTRQSSNDPSAGYYPGRRHGKHLLGIQAPKRYPSTYLRRALRKTGQSVDTAWRVVQTSEIWNVQIGAGTSDATLYAERLWSLSRWLDADAVLT